MVVGSGLRRELERWSSPRRLLQLIVTGFAVALLCLLGRTGSVHAADTTASTKGVAPVTVAPVTVAVSAPASTSQPPAAAVPAPASTSQPPAAAAPQSALRGGTPDVAARPPIAVRGEPSSRPPDPTAVPPLQGRPTTVVVRAPAIPEGNQGGANGEGDLPEAAPVVSVVDPPGGGPPVTAVSVPVSSPPRPALAGNPVTGNPVTGNPATGNPPPDNPPPDNPPPDNPPPDNPPPDNPPPDNPPPDNPPPDNPPPDNPPPDNPPADDPLADDPAPGPAPDSAPAARTWLEQPSTPASASMTEQEPAVRTAAPVRAADTGSSGKGLFMMLRTQDMVRAAWVEGSQQGAPDGAMAATRQPSGGGGIPSGPPSPSPGGGPPAGASSSVPSSSHSPRPFGAAVMVDVEAPLLVQPRLSVQSPSQLLRLAPLSLIERPG
jgi:hypothetical protein